MNIKQLQINYMQELIFRLNDYFFCQFIYAATDANPYQDLIDRLRVEIDPFADEQAYSPGPDDGSDDLDLK